RTRRPMPTCSQPSRRDPHLPGRGHGTGVATTVPGCRPCTGLEPPVEAVVWKAWFYPSSYLKQRADLQGETWICSGLRESQISIRSLHRFEKEQPGSTSRGSGDLPGMQGRRRFPYSESLDAIRCGAHCNKASV